MTDMDIYEIRRKNLQWLVDERFPGHGQKSKLAEFMGWKQPRASAVLSGKNLGGTASRNIELKFALARGWLDEAHWHLWEGISADSISEAERVYPKATQKTLPVLTGATLQAFLNGDSSVTTKHWKSIDLAIPAKRMFILLEETSALSPMWQPGDVHYVDPDTPAEHGRLAVFVVNGRGMVGIFERGAAGDRLTFNNPREPVVDVTNATFAGSVMVTFKREFYDQITGKA